MIIKDQCVRCSDIWWLCWGLQPHISRLPLATCDIPLESFAYVPTFKKKIYIFPPASTGAPWRCGSRPSSCRAMPYTRCRHCTASTFPLRCDTTWPSGLRASSGMKYILILNVIQNLWIGSSVTLCRAVAMSGMDLFTGSISVFGQNQLKYTWHLISFYKGKKRRYDIWSKHHRLKEERRKHKHSDNHHKDSFCICPRTFISDYQILLCSVCLPLLGS